MDPVGKGVTKVFFCFVLFFFFSFICRVHVLQKDNGLKGVEISPETVVTVQYAGR